MMVNTEEMMKAAVIMRDAAEAMTQAAALSERWARAAIQAAGMQAENMMRMHRGLSPAYVENDFCALLQ